MANLMSSSLIPSESDDEVDPMSGLGNLMDVMLVFACGLILALIGYYNVDISNNNSADYKELNASISYGQTQTTKATSEYTQLGTVYQDNDTGKMYIVEPDDGSSSSSSHADVTDSSSTSSESK